MEFTYTVKRSAKRKKLTITVERDRSVIVHAPVRASEAAIRKAVASKRGWIYEKIHHGNKYRDVPHPPGKELVSGESALYLGRQYRIEIVDHGQDAISFTQKIFISPSLVGRKMNGMRTWYIERAHQKILPRVQRHAKQLGVRFKEAKIVDNRYRWGACTVKDNVNLNWRLIKAPMFVIDYVIVHELAHLLENNHTPRFWNIVRAQSPKMEKAKLWLKEHGQLLEEEI